MLIYRIEDADGIGAYQATASEIYELVGYFGVPRHPAPSKDDKLMQSLLQKSGSTNFCGLCVFGFDSLNQLKNWFYSNELLNVLISAELFISIYDVPDDSVYTGNTQACFKIKYHAPEFFREKIELKTLLDN